MIYEDLLRIYAYRYSRIQQMQDFCTPEYFKECLEDYRTIIEDLKSMTDETERA